MNDTKIYYALLYFTPEEQKSFRNYLISPYFNKSEKLAKLYQLIISHINKNPEARLEKSKLWKKLGMVGPMDDVRFRKFNSDLFKLAEQFLAQKIYEENDEKRFINLLEAIGRKKLKKLVNNTDMKARRAFNNQKHLSATYYYNWYSLEKTYYDTKESELHRSEKTNIEAISNHLDLFYLSEKLRYLCSARTQEKYVDFNYQIKYIEEILEALKDLEIDNYPALAIYHQIYLTITESENDSNFHRLSELLQKHGADFPKNEALTIYYSAVNYCISKINSGNHDFYKNLFEVYEEMVIKEIIVSEQGEVSPWDFKNIVLIGLNTKNYDWTENFIKEFGKKIPSKYRKNAVTYNLGQLYFYKKEYQNVLEQLRNVEYDDITYSLNSKTMLAWTFLELDEIDLLISHIDSFRIFIKRHKDISPARKKRHSNYLRLVKKLGNTIKGDTKSIVKIQKDIEKLKGEGIVGLNWIKTKLNELAK